MYRKVRDTLRGVAEPDSLEKLLSTFADTLFPGGERRPPSEDRTEDEKYATRLRASKKLALLIPGQLSPLEDQSGVEN